MKAVTLNDDSSPELIKTMELMGFSSVRAFYAEKIMESTDWEDLYASLGTSINQIIDKLQADGVDIPTVVEIIEEQGIYKTII